MSYTASCPTCTNEWDFDNRARMERTTKEWDVRRGLVLDKSEAGELLLAFRELRSATERKIRNNERRLTTWSDTDEASNPGYRQFLVDAKAGSHERLERIEAMIRRVNRVREN